MITTFQQVLLKDWGITHLILDQSKVSLMREVTLTFRNEKSLCKFLRRDLTSILLYIGDKRFLRQAERGIMEHYFLGMNQADQRGVKVDFKKRQASITFSKILESKEEPSLPPYCLILSTQDNQYINLKGLTPYSIPMPFQASFAH